MNDSKKRAIELVDKFYQTTPNEAWINEPLGLSKEYTAWEQAKECALIAIDEILNIYINFPKHPQSIYWQEVKNELSNL